MEGRRRWSPGIPATRVPTPCETRWDCTGRSSDTAVAQSGPGEDKTNIGCGFAYMRFKLAGNYIAIAMEVAVDTVSGEIALPRLGCAHDNGLVVNPGAIRNQIAGCIQPDPA